MTAQGDHTMTGVPAGRVTLADRRTRRSWAVDVGFRLARTLPDRAAGPDQSGSRPSV
ncbi:hypothetical protein ACF09E_08695 [Streptomyces sp. NPDC014891]|uniref:hypothetical protein n=1 Tax=Streptomyces sp. NPDC014891 TaxID=3364929 RepID=UPI0036F794FD